MLGEIGTSADSDLQKLDAHLSLFRRDTDLALELARNAVPKDSKKYEHYVWQGLFLDDLERPNDAVKSLQKATEVAPENPQPWVVLIEFMKNRKYSKEEMKKKMREMQDKVLPEKRALALARCYQIIDEPGWTDPGHILEAEYNLFGGFSFPAS